MRIIDKPNCDPRCAYFPNVVANDTRIEYVGDYKVTYNKTSCKRCGYNNNKINNYYTFVCERGSPLVKRRKMTSDN